MMKRLGVSLLATMLAAATGGPAAVAQSDLVITEIWQHGSDDTTPDWFELTNFGDTTIDPSLLYYDDDSGDATEDTQLTGITSLGPGESAVYLVSWHDDFPGSDFPPPFDPSDAVAAFESFWGTNGDYQVGHLVDPDTAGGSGLGGGGDGVFVFDGNTAAANLVDSKLYSDGSNEFPDDNSGVTWVYNPLSPDLQHAQLGVLGAFESVDGRQVGSPGYAVPEPASLGLVLLGVVAAFGGRRRTR